MVGKPAFGELGARKESRCTGGGDSVLYEKREKSLSLKWEHSGTAARIFLKKAARQRVGIEKETDV